MKASTIQVRMAPSTAVLQRPNPAATPILLHVMRSQRDDRGASSWYGDVLCSYMDTGLSRNSHSRSSPSGARAQGLAAFIPCSHRGDRHLFPGPLSTSSCVGNGAGANLQQSLEQALCLQKGDHQSRRMATIRQHFRCSPAPSALVDTACGACMMRRYVPSRVNVSPYAATG